MDDNPDFLNLTPDSEAESVSVPEPSTAETPEQEPDQALPSDADESGPEPEVTFQGNSYDLTAVIGVTIGALVLLTCATCNMGFYCLPLIPIILGIIGLIAAKDSVNPERTKLLSWLSVGSGTIIFLLILLFVAIYIGLIIFAIIADNGGF
jgi:hypothetical protein